MAEGHQIVALNGCVVTPCDFRSPYTMSAGFKNVWDWGTLLRDKLCFCTLNVTRKYGYSKRRRVGAD